MCCCCLVFSLIVINILQTAEYRVSNLEVTSYWIFQGPVYELKWSPFLPDVFLSCSADWSVKLWHQDSLSPIYTFTSSTVSFYY
jgi:WD40 repeat protein